MFAEQTSFSGDEKVHVGPFGGRCEKCDFYFTMDIDGKE